MTETSDLRELLLTYRLGKLSAEEREKLDEQMVGNQEFSDRLAEAEYDLLDDYRSGRLTPAQGRRVKSAFSPEELKRGPVVATEVSTVSMPTARRAGLRFVRPAIAASILAVAAGLLILYVHQPQSPPPLEKAQSTPAPAASLAPNSQTTSAPPDQSSKNSAQTSSALATLLLEPAVARGANGPVLDLPRSVHVVRVQWVLPAAISSPYFSLSVTQGSSVLTTVYQHGRIQNAGGSQLAEFNLDASVFARYPGNTRFLFIVNARGAQHAAVGEYPVIVRKD